MAGFLPSSETILPAQDCDGSKRCRSNKPLPPSSSGTPIARLHAAVVHSSMQVARCQPNITAARAGINRGCVLRGRDVDMANRIADLLL
jgi:hypothetical protein